MTNMKHCQCISSNTDYFQPPLSVNSPITNLNEGIKWVGVIVVMVCIMLR